MNYLNVKFIISACLLGVSYLNISCKNVADNAPSQKHLSRLEFNRQLSPILSKNSNPRFKYLLAKLDTVYLNDQKFRDVYDASYLGKNIEKQKLLDKQNQGSIGAILDSFGYLNKADIGLVGQKAINLTLLHADLHFKKRYRQVVEDAFRQKKIFVNTYASFMDKMLLQETNMQRFGTQLITFKGKTMYAPMTIDSMELYQRQLGVQLDSMTNALYPQPNIDKAEYKKLLPELVAYHKKNIAPLNY